VDGGSKGLSELFTWQKNASVIARAQARGNLPNSEKRLLRRFTPRNDTAFMPYFSGNGIIPKTF
jgi:hypothetical protein